MFNKIKETIKLAAFAAPLYAQETIGTLKLEAKGDDFSSLRDLTIPGVLSGAITLVLIIVAIVFFFILVLGGLKWVTSGGDEKKVAAARAQITNALIGLAIVFAAWAIMNLIGVLFNINIFELTIQSFV